MKIKPETLFRFGILLVMSLLLGSLSISVAYANPLPQDTRPPQDGGGGDGEGEGNGEPGGNGASGPGCASLVGQMINWGSGGEGGVTAELRSGSWQISTVSATDGNYAIGGLGVGMAVLHVALTSEQATRFQPLIQDAGLYLNCEFPLIANIALADNVTIDPPVTIEMSASRTVLQPGQNAIISLTINNGLPNEITNVVVTDLFTPGLRPMDVTAGVGAGAIKIVDGYEYGQLVAVNLGKVATGAQVTIDITVVADTPLIDTSGFRNVATVFYRESVAHQASLDFTIGGGVSIPAPLAATATIAPVADTTPEADSLALPTPAAAPTARSEAVAPAVDTSSTVADETENGEDFVPPNGLPTTGDNFVPPPGLLPVTGQISAQISNQLSGPGLSPLLPLSGLAVAGLTFMLYQWHAFRQKRAHKPRKE